MTENQKTHSVITPEEIAMLNGVGKKMRPSGVDRGFRTRHALLSLLFLFFMTRLLLYPEKMQGVLRKLCITPLSVCYL
jgi:hypothetical protein